MEVSVDEPSPEHYFTNIFRLPVLETSNQPKFEGIIIPFLVLLCCGFSFFAKTGSEMLGFNTALPWRLGGLTLITSLFIQVGLIHVISNTYFLYLFGQHLEPLLVLFLIHVWYLHEFRMCHFKYKQSLMCG